MDVAANDASVCEVVNKHATNARRKLGQSMQQSLQTGIAAAKSRAYNVADKQYLMVSSSVLDANPAFEAASSSLQDNNNNIGDEIEGGQEEEADDENRNRFFGSPASIGGKHGDKSKDKKKKKARGGIVSTPTPVSPHAHRHRRYRRRPHRHAHRRATILALPDTPVIVEQRKIAPPTPAVRLFRLTIADANGTPSLSSTYVYDPREQAEFGGERRQYQVINDHQTMVQLHNEQGFGVSSIIPAEGLWSLSVRDPDNGSVSTRGGKYDFEYAMSRYAHNSLQGNADAASLYYTLRVSVFDHSLVSKNIKYQTGVSELWIKVQPLASNNSAVRVVSIALVLFVHADERWFSDRTHTMAVTPTPDVTFASFYQADRLPVQRVPYDSSDKAKLEEAVNKTLLKTRSGTAVLEAPAGSSALLEVPATAPAASSIGTKNSGGFASLLFGDASGYQSELLAVGANGAVIVDEKQTPQQAKQLYRLGDISAPLSTMALMGYFIENTPKVAQDAGEGSVLNLDDPTLTAHFLSSTGAHAIRAALEQCYKDVGSGALPSINQLLNHTSGLPAELPASPELVCKLAGTQLDDSDSSQCEHVAKVLAERVVPLCEPGARHNYSPLGLAVLGYCVNDWQTGGAERMVESRVRAMGFDGITFDAARSSSSSSQQQQRNVAACFSDTTINIGASPASHVETVRRERTISLADQGMYNLSCGLYGEVASVARAMSDALPWYSSTATVNKRNSDATVSGDSNPASLSHTTRFGYLGQMLAPQVTIDKESALYSGYGMEHMTINYHGQQLRALVKIGNVRGAHTSVVAMVPALHVSAAFSTNADALKLAENYSGDSNGSLVPLVEHMVGYVLDKAPASALCYDAAAEHLASFKPGESQHYAEMRAYNKRVTKHLFDNDAALQRVIGSQFVGRTFHSLGEHLNNLPCETLRITGVDAEPVFGVADKKALLLELGTERTRGGQVASTMSVPLAFDAHAVDPNFVMASRGGNSSEGVKRGGALRMIEPCTGFVGEFLSLSMVGAEPVLSFRGQLYVDSQFSQRAGEAVSKKQQEAVANPAPSQRVSLVQSALAQQQQQRNIAGHNRGATAAGVLAGATLGGLAGALLLPRYHGPHYYRRYPPAWYRRGNGYGWRRGRGRGHHKKHPHGPFA